MTGVRRRPLRVTQDLSQPDPHKSPLQVPHRDPNLGCPSRAPRGYTGRVSILWGPERVRPLDEFSVPTPSLTLVHKRTNMTALGLYTRLQSVPHSPLLDSTCTSLDVLDLSFVPYVVSGSHTFFPLSVTVISEPPRTRI